MKTAAVVLSLAAMAVQAQPVQVERSVVCDSTDKILNHFQDKLGEKPVWMGTGGSKSIFLLVQHPETKEWSMLHFNDRVACVLGTGSNSKPIELPKRLM